MYLTDPLGLGAEIKPVGLHSAVNFEDTTCAPFGEGKLKTHTWHSTKYFFGSSGSQIHHVQPEIVLVSHTEDPRTHRIYKLGNIVIQLFH